MNTKGIMWTIAGGFTALLVMLSLILVMIFYRTSDKPECIGQCAFVSDVRDTGKYADRTDLEISEYGQELCVTLKNGASAIVYALESEKVIESAIKNLCPEVVQ